MTKPTPGDEIEQPMKPICDSRILHDFLENINIENVMET